MLLQPKRAAFEDALPMLSYTDMDQIYYPRVLDRISGGPIPDDVLNHPNYTAKLLMRGQKQDFMCLALFEC